jgi:hypothetical protein
VRIILELESADPETLLSSDALEAFGALSRAGIHVTRVDPATGITDPPIVARMRETLVSRGRRLETAFTEATRAAVEVMPGTFGEYDVDGRFIGEPP